jgi:O-antigen biosynthesis protein
LAGGGLDYAGPVLAGLLRPFGGAARKAVTHFRLLRDDPERFGRNLMQVTHPGIFEDRLVDVLDAVPMHVSIDRATPGPAHLNVLNSALTRSGMTGGPNTIINLALRIARLGVPLRLVTTVATSTMDPAWFRDHAAALVGDHDLPDVPIVSASDPLCPLVVGPHDIFLATHWTTAQQVKAVLPSMAVQQFFYMLQEFEPAFYAWSSNYALALETYDLDFWPIFNEALLADYLFGHGVGRLADPAMRMRATIFEPAIEERVFHPEAFPVSGRPKRLLFYARPSNTRNMFGLGLMALRRASADPAFNGWQFRSIGGRGSLPSIRLENGHVLQPEAWMDYTAYARSLRDADVLLCPMLSPHTSYPVLEMAASGGLSVTNTFATKTRGALESLSDNIIATAPTEAAMTAGLVMAAARVNAGRMRTGSINMARDWATTLDPAAARVAELFGQLTCGRDVR